MDQYGSKMTHFCHSINAWKQTAKLLLHLFFRILVYFRALDGIYEQTWF